MPKNKDDNASSDWDAHWNVVIRVRLKPFRDAVAWSMYRPLLKAMDIPDEGMSVLELAVGEGFQTAKLIKKYGGSGVGVDINDIPVELSRRQARRFHIEDRMEIIKGDIFQVRRILGNRKFYLVHSEGIMEHFPEDKQLELMKIHRDMSSRYVIVFTPWPSPHYWGIRSLVTALGAWIYPDENPMTAEQIADLGRRAGMTVVKTTRHFWENGVLFKV